MIKYRPFRILLFISTCFSYSTACGESAQGLIQVESKHSVSQTIDRLAEALSNKGMTIFKRISHSEGAAKVGLKLRPTELLIFGNPKLGTLMMQCQQTAAIDFPLKALAYEDEQGKVWLAYNDPGYIADRHRTTDCDKVVKKMSAALAAFSSAATR